MSQLILSSFLTLLLITNSWAKNPCDPVNFKIDNKNIILPGSPSPKQSIVYFFKNKSNSSIWIDHPMTNNPGVSAGWSSYIRPGHWSALVLNKKNFAVSCAMIQPGKVVYMNCSATLDVCAPSNLTSEKVLNGNFWLAEDKPYDAFINVLTKRGIKIN